MYQYIPPKRNQKAQKIIGILFLGGILLLFLPSLLQIPFRSFFQVCGVGCLTGSVFLVTRYVTKSFLYRVEANDDGSLDFTVTEIQNNKRQITVCRIALSDIRDIVTVKQADRAAVNAVKERIRKEQRRSFYYCPELAPSEACYLFVSEPSSGLLVVVINPDETLLRILEEHKGEDGED